MKLKVLERATMFSFFPKQGTEQENEFIISVAKKIGFEDKEEMEELSIVFHENGSFQYNAEKDGDGKDVALTIAERNFMLTCLDKANQEGSIQTIVYPVYKELKRKLNED